MANNPGHSGFASKPLPFPFPRDDPLVQGSDIELAPTQRPFHEHAANPAPEFIQHSTLEVAAAAKYAPSSPPGSPPQYLSPGAPPHPGNAFDPGSKKAWELSRSNSLYSASQPPPSAGAPGAAQGRYSYSDFSSPFDNRPLVGGGGGSQPPQLPGTAAGYGGRRERICGVRRQVFWIILAVAVFLAVVAIATGVGVGVGTAGKSNQSTPTATPSATATRAFPTPTATSTSSDSSLIVCPSNNLTLYTPSQNTKKKFVLLCGRDYNSQLGNTVDMYNTPVDSLEGCLALCAGQDGCVGAGWGRGSTDNGDAVCWLKSFLGPPNNAPGWSFFAEDTDDGGK